MDNFGYLHAIQPPKFNVESTNIKRFFKRFERYVSIQNDNWDDELKVNVLGNLLLDNRSFDYFENITEGIRRVYINTKESMIGHYNDSKSDLKGVHTLQDFC